MRNLLIVLFATLLTWVLVLAVRLQLFFPEFQALRPGTFSIVGYLLEGQTAWTYWAQQRKMVYG